MSKQFALVSGFLWIIVEMASSSRILTKNMIKSSDFYREPVEFLPVALKSREEIIVPKDQSILTTLKPEFIRKDPELNDNYNYRSVDFVESTDLTTTDFPEGRSVDEESEEDENVDEIADIETPNDDSTNSTSVDAETETSTAVTVDKYRGIGGDLWLMMTRAYECLWSGYTMDCISSRVVPLFRSMMGYSPSYYANPYLIPRSQEEAKSGPWHSHKRRKHLVPIIVGLLMIKFVILPALGGIALATGKALLFSMLALGAAAFSSLHSSRYASKRLDEVTPQQYYPYQ